MPCATFLVQAPTIFRCRFLFPAPSRRFSPAAPPQPVCEARHTVSAPPAGGRTTEASPAASGTAAVPLAAACGLAGWAPLCSQGGCVGLAGRRGADPTKETGQRGKSRACRLQLLSLVPPLFRYGSPGPQGRRLVHRQLQPPLPHGRRRQGMEGGSGAAVVVARLGRLQHGSGHPAPTTRLRQCQTTTPPAGRCVRGGSGRRQAAAKARGSGAARCRAP